MFDYFANDTRQWEVQEHQEQNSEEEDGAGDEGFIGSEGQIFHNTLMGQLLQYQL